MRNRASAYASVLWLAVLAALLGACGPTTVTEAEIEAARAYCERAGCNTLAWGD
jgi:hypothetical protein